MEAKRDRGPALQDAVALTTRLRTSARFWSASAPAALFPSRDGDQRIVLNLDSPPRLSESGTGVPHSKTLSRPPRASERPPDFLCASAPAGLFPLRDGDQRIVLNLDSPPRLSESGTGVPHSKTLPRPPRASRISARFCRAPPLRAFPSPHLPPKKFFHFP